MNKQGSLNLYPLDVIISTSSGLRLLWRFQRTYINMLHNIGFRYCYTSKFGSVEINLNMKFSIDFHKRLHWIAIFKGIFKLLLKKQ